MLTAIWQDRDFKENEWIDELFGHYISTHVQDCDHKITMDNCLVIDKFIHKKPISYYQKFRDRNNVYLLHLSDEQYHGGYKAYEYFTAVFRNYWSDIFNPNSVCVLPLGYCNGIKSDNPLKSASKRNYIWSFAGELARSSRPEMIRALDSIQPSFRHASDPPDLRLLPPAQYKYILQESIFAPCPMGRVNLECFRLYEALECGAIPIVERRTAIDYFSQLFGPHPLPTVKIWSEAIPLIEFLSKEPARIDGKQEEINSWWKAHKKSLQARISKIISHETHISMRSDAVTSWKYRLPFWQVLELARHHSGKALARRVQTECQRLVAY